MQVLYFGEICDNLLFEDKLKNSRPYFVAQFSYEKALRDQLLHSEELTIQTVGVNLVNNYPKGPLLFNRSSRDGISYLPFINLPIIKEFFFSFTSFFHVLFWYLKASNDSKKVVYTSIHYTPVSLGIVLSTKIVGIKRVITFTDLDVFTFSSEKILKMPFYKRLLIKPYLSLNRFLQRQFDGYVLFTSAMNQWVNPLGKPSKVVEGIHNIRRKREGPISKKSQVLAHAGTLNREYGIKMVLDVFDALPDPTLELWLFGNGDMVEEIENRASRDLRIKFFGFVDRDELIVKLGQAKLLLNLRDPNLLYTKYSFPSKLFEYMTSGTPVVTTKLEGIPVEYHDYLLIPETYDKDAIVKYIQKCLTMNDNLLESKANAAFNFVRENKTAKSQVKKIVELIKDIVNECQ